MKRRRIIGTIVFVSLVALMALLFNAFRQPSNFEYNGRRLSEWLVDLRNDDNLDAKEKAEYVVSQIGSNAVPLLVEYLQTEETAAKQFLRAAARKNSWADRMVNQSVSEVGMKQIVAALGFRAIGTNGAVAIPMLSELMFTRTNLWSIPYVLSSIGKPAENILIQALQYAGNDHLQMRATYAIGSIYPPDERTISILISNLNHGTRRVQVASADTLGVLQAKSEITIPALIRSLGNSNTISPALISLGRYGTNAAEALPFVAKLTNSPIRDISLRARTALSKIKPKERKGEE